MANIVCCLKVKESYIRITNPFKDHSDIRFEKFIDDIDELKDLAVYKKWDIAVIDKNISYFNESIKLLNKSNTNIVFFDGDYKTVIDNLKEKLECYTDQLEEEKEEKVSSAGVRYIEKPVTKFVEKKIYTNIERKTILVIGLTKGAGSTSLTLNIAKHLSNCGILSSVVEPPINPEIANWIGVNNILENENDFYSYPYAISNCEKIEANKEFLFDNIIWIIPKENEKASDWSINEMLKLVYISNKAPITLVDAGCNFMHESVEPFISMADLVIFVIDPFPSSLDLNIEGLEEIKNLKKEGCNIEFVVNKWNEGIDKKDFLNFIGVEPLAFIPAIELNLLYKANYLHKIPFSLKEVEEIIGKPIRKICSLFIPEGLCLTPAIKKDSGGKDNIFLPLINFFKKIKTLKIKNK
jgi:hypothetical protein